MGIVLRQLVPNFQIRNIKKWRLNKFGSLGFRGANCSKGVCHPRIWDEIDPCPQMWDAGDTPVLSTPRNPREPDLFLHNGNINTIPSGSSLFSILYFVGEDKRAVVISAHSWKAEKSSNFPAFQSSNLPTLTFLFYFATNWW